MRSYSFKLLVFLTLFFLIIISPFFPKSSSHASSSVFIDVVAEIPQACQCLQVTVYNFNFGVYDYTNGNMHTTDIVVDAPVDHPYVITLSKGDHKGHAGNFPGRARRARAMVGTSEDYHLGYYLFTVDRFHDEDEWGDEGFGNTYMAFPASFWGTGQGQPHTIYGWIPSGQNVPPGSYCDIVLVNVHP